MNFVVKALGKIMDVFQKCKFDQVKKLGLGRQLKKKLVPCCD